MYVYTYVLLNITCSVRILLLVVSVFRADLLVLDNHLACSSPRKTAFPASIHLGKSIGGVLVQLPLEQTTSSLIPFPESATGRCGPI